MSDDVTAQLDHAIEEHVSGLWPDRVVSERRWSSGKIVDVIPDFRVLEVAPQASGGAWVYASSGAWRVPVSDHHLLEFLILSPVQSEVNVETLAMVAAMHSDERYRMHLYKVLNVGRPWLPGSSCDHLLLVPPYFLDEGGGEIHSEGHGISYYWLMPITASEAQFANECGGMALGEAIAGMDVDVLQVDRPSVK